MSPTSLLNVSSDLLRQHGQLGLPSPMASASDRSWAMAVCFGLATVATLLIVLLH